MLSKQIYQRGVLLSSPGSLPVDRLLAIIQFDWAIENSIKAVFRALDTSSRIPLQFPSLISDTNDLLKRNNLGLIPDKAHLDYIHNIRNDAQHHGRFPNETELVDCQVYARDFHISLLKLVWNADFLTLSVTDLVQDKTCRTFLQSAEKEFSISNYQDAIKNAGIAVEMAITKVESVAIGEIPKFSFNKIRIANKDIIFADDRQFDKVHDALERRGKMLLFVILGLNYSNYIKFREIAGKITFGGGWHPWIVNSKQNPSREDAEFIVSFSIATLLQIEGQVTNLDKPFGAKRWWPM